MASSLRLKAGDVLAGYQIESVLGTGGMGEVYRATQISLKRPVAIKVLSSAWTGNPQSLQRFEREARIQVELNHPNLVKLYDASMTPENRFLVMELVEGMTLRERLGNQSPLSLSAVISIIKGILAGLEYLHAQGFVHRDLKPGNVMLEGSGLVKIMDFGLSRGESLTMLTSSSQVVGTLPYLAPEVVDGDEASPASDVYSAGVVAYEILTRRLPYDAENVNDWVQLLRTTDPAPISRWVTSVPRELTRAVMGFLDHDPSHRPTAAAAAGSMSTLFPTSGEFAQVQVAPVPRVTDDEKDTPGAFAAAPGPRGQGRRPPRGRRSRWTISLVSSCLLMVAALGLAVTRMDPGHPGATAAPAVPHAAEVLEVGLLERHVTITDRKVFWSARTRIPVKLSLTLREQAGDSTSTVSDKHPGCWHRFVIEVTPGMKYTLACTVLEGTRPDAPEAVQVPFKAFPEHDFVAVPLPASFARSCKRALEILNSAIAFQRRENIQDPVEIAHMMDLFRVVDARHPYLWTDEGCSTLVSYYRRRDWGFDEILLALGGEVAGDDLRDELLKRLRPVDEPLAAEELWRHFRLVHRVIRALCEVGDERCLGAVESFLSSGYLLWEKPLKLMGGSGDITSQWEMGARELSTYHPDRAHALARRLRAGSARKHAHLLGCMPWMEETELAGCFMQSSADARHGALLGMGPGRVSREWLASISRPGVLRSIAWEEAVVGGNLLVMLDPQRGVPLLMDLARRSMKLPGIPAYRLNMIRLLGAPGDPRCLPLLGEYVLEPPVPEAARIALRAIADAAFRARFTGAPAGAAPGAAAALDPALERVIPVVEGNDAGDDAGAEKLLALSFLGSRHAKSLALGYHQHGSNYQKWVAGVCLAYMGFLPTEHGMRIGPGASPRELRDIMLPMWSRLSWIFQEARRPDRRLFLLDPATCGLRTGLEVRIGDRVEVVFAGAATPKAVTEPGSQKERPLDLRTSDELVLPPQDLWLVPQVGAHRMLGSPAFKGENQKPMAAHVETALDSGSLILDHDLHRSRSPLMYWHRHGAHLVRHAGLTLALVRILPREP